MLWVMQLVSESLGPWILNVWRLEAGETGAESPRLSGGRLGRTRVCRDREGNREGETSKVGWVVVGIMRMLAALAWRVPEWVWE